MGNKIFEFIKNKEFPINIQLIEDGEKILDTGGGILNMIENSKENDFIIFNPDTLWQETYINEIIEMQNFYLSNKLDNILLLANKKLSFDKKLKGDFNLENNLIDKEAEREFIYIGCQIMNKKLFSRNKIETFSVVEIWNNLLDIKKLYGYESYNNFYHLTDLNIFNKLKDL